MTADSPSAASSLPSTVYCSQLGTMRVPTFLACLAAVVTLAKCDHTTPSDSPVFKKGQWTKHLQNATTCNTQGEKQWAGTVDISDARRLFYWYFDSRHDPDNDPIILWLSG